MRQSQEGLAVAVVLSAMLLYGCSSLAGIAMDAVTGSSSKGGINTELVVGDKQQVLGTNQQVKAGTIGKVTGTSDNSVSATGAEQVIVNNNSIPVWLIGILLTMASLVGWLLPRPKAWKRLIGSKTNGD